jgi:FtsP/CotA-like multicopper oxidase with cupredoxin domain
MRNLFVIFVAGAVLALQADDISQPCRRPFTGSAIASPPEIRSADGKLEVNLSLRGVPAAGTFCYSSAGAESPTLRLHPGDDLILNLENRLPSAAPTTAAHDSHVCGGAPMTAVSTNLHFHGLEIPPACHQDEVIHTLIAPSQTFQYRVKIPASQPPGLYWYHPHPHGYSEAQVLGGASGAIVIEGIERERPEVAGLPERILVLRDQPAVGRAATDDDDAGPGKDVSLNFVPVSMPTSIPGNILVRPESREFWRVLNASADTYFDLQVVYRSGAQRGGTPQNLNLVALDGVPVSEKRFSMPVTNILLTPGARAEFVVVTPPAGMFAQLVRRAYDTGPDGEVTPARALADIIGRPDAPVASSRLPLGNETAGSQKLVPLSQVKPTATRKLYFSEERIGAKGQAGAVRYYVTPDGGAPKMFDMNFKTPDITVRQGVVEDWTIENRAQEAHSFHIHQVHFQVVARNGVAVNELELRDTVDLPFWDGKASLYPSVTLRVDFRSPYIVGTFLYHCHILEHEDGGMMGAIQVLPSVR